MEGHDITIRVESIDDPCRIAVRIIHDRLIAIDLFQALGIEIHLMSALLRGNGSFLDLNDCQRLRITPGENIITVSQTGWIRHALYFYFYARFSRKDHIFLVEDLPPGFAKIQVHIQPAGLGFAHVRWSLIGIGGPALLGSDQAD